MGVMRGPLPTALAPRSAALGLLAVLQATLSTHGAAQSATTLFMWNPHWQCSVWDNFDCREQAGITLGVVLSSAGVDFANVVELEDEDYWSSGLPPGYKTLAMQCGQDVINLVWNNKLWRRDMAAGSNVSGCMTQSRGAPDRPYIAQLFKDTRGGDDVIVVGAHFPHPSSDRDMDTYRRTASVDGLRDALKSIMRSTGVKHVILIADTNAWDWVPSSVLMKALQLPGGPLLSTSLERTCCFDNDFAVWGTFDRIMANFGAELTTRVLFQNSLPFWANQTRGTKRGAFHLPVLGVLIPSAAEASGRETVLIIVLGVAVGVLLLGVGILLVHILSRRTSKASGEGQDEESSDG